MWAALKTVFTDIIAFVGEVITAMFGTGGAWEELQEFFVLGIGISVIMVSAKIIRKVVWGA